MTIVYFILAALALGVLILIHELGHLLVAKCVGMTVESFSIGFGPAIFKKKIGEIEYRVGIILFGGYVRIKGMEKSRGAENEEKEESVYDIPNGFFSKSPWKRILVLAAGPLANVLFAIVAFGGVYLVGGRSKAFSEYTSILGWVNPSLKQKGLEAGDRLIVCNGRPYQGGDKAVFTSALLDGHLSLVGEHPAYLSTEAIPFSLDVEYNPERLGYPCLGASYLLFRDDTPLSPHSPIYGLGLQKGDRLVWMDGELLFSPMQVSELLNEAFAFVRVQRDGKEFWIRQPRVLASSLFLSQHVRNELMDNQYEAGLKGRWSSLYILPYVINSYGYVESELAPVDPVSDRNPVFEKLELGDKILAIDGVPVESNVDILRLVQEHKVCLIVQRLSDEQLRLMEPSAADNQFLTSYCREDLEKILLSLGTSSVVKEVGSYRLISGVQPKPWATIYSEELLDTQKALAKKITNREKQRHYLERVEAEKRRLSLGMPLQDLAVRYNPNPFSLMQTITKDGVGAAKALVSGRLHPQWLSGPLGIMKILHTGWSLGISEALFWMGSISMNLAVLNLLPVPVLDGGYIVLCLWEWLSRRRLNMRVVEKVLIPFTLLLVAFFIFLTFQDLFRSFVG